ncbi:hypothetical protein BST81_10645 [Leptolyngbya sp. 'hensonii']|nr:hypothetical protein BST81_10645 [Leptolyngbya sp. 'hensonii']
MIDSLRRKPRAFLYCQWQQDLLPNPPWQDLGQQLKAAVETDLAARLIVEALYLAATHNQESAIADFLQTQLQQGRLSLSRLQQQFQPQSHASMAPHIMSHRYERRSFLITANQPFSHGDTIFPDSMIALAAIDRLVHHPTIIEF